MTLGMLFTKPYGLQALCLAASLPVLAGCAQPPARVDIQRIHIAVPMPCHEPEPPRPSMPTEHLAGDASVDAYVQAAAAEIERREGYELQLQAALRNCQSPLPDVVE